MAYNHASAFFLIALIFFATANPLAHGQLLPGSPRLPIPTPGLPIPTPGLPLPAPGLPIPTPGLPLPTPGLPIPTPGLPLPTPGLPIPTPGLPLPAPGLPIPAPGLPPVIPGLLRNVTINGTVCCTRTGNCLPGSPPAAGAVVDVNCTGLTGTVRRIGQGITTANGSFSITVNLGSLLSGPFCVVRIRLPLNATICPVLSNVNGALVGIIGPITLLLNQLVATVLGLVRVGI